LGKNTVTRSVNVADYVLILNHIRHAKRTLGGLSENDVKLPAAESLEVV